MKSILVILASSIFLAASQDQYYPQYRHPHEARQQLLKEINQWNSTNIALIRSVYEALKNPDILKGLENVSISNTCSDQLTWYYDSLLDGNEWAVKMFDSAGKPGSGIRTGNLRFLGDYDECLAVQSDWNSTLPDSYKFRGKYCTSATVGGTFSEGVCFPENCTNSDVWLLMNYLANKVSPQLSVPWTYCQERDTPLSSTAIATIVVYSLFGALCIIASIFDYCHQNLMSTIAAEDASPILTENEDPNVQSEMSKVPLKLTPKLGHAGKLLLCFSMYTNASKLLSAKKNPDSLGCLHGIRFISMTWVILGHTLVINLQMFSNLGDIGVWIKRWTFGPIINATVSVDSFFCIGGLLTAYLMLKQFEQSNPNFKSFLVSVPVMYLHRWIRLTPAYGFMILFYTGMPYYLANGPLRNPNNITDQLCTNQTWINLLYVNTLVGSANECVAWGWYLGNDFLFFIIAPWIIYLMHKKAVIGAVCQLILSLLSVGCAMGHSLKYDLGIGGGSRDPNNPNPHAGDGFNNYYFRPWTRYQSYGFGCLMGMALWKLKGRFTIKWWINLILLGVSGAIMLSYMYGDYEVYSLQRVATKFEATLFNGFARSAWCIALGYLIIACCNGQGGIIDEFLSWPGFIPLSRLTYCAYLWHPVVMITIQYGQHHLIAFNEYQYAMLFCGFVALTHGVAFIHSLLFEAPFMNLDKNYLTGLISRKRER